MPKSVVGNWIKEFKKWCPSIKAIRMGGTKEERKRAVTQDLKPNEDGKYGFDALVCSYEAVLKEKSALGKIPWRYLIIDEAHRIKNENSSLSKAVRLLNTGFRLLITGTPLQVRFVLILMYSLKIALTHFATTLVAESRTICTSCGLCSTFCCLKSLVTRSSLMSGLVCLVKRDRKM